MFSVQFWMLHNPDYKSSLWTSFMCHSGYFKHSKLGYAIMSCTWCKGYIHSLRGVMYPVVLLHSDSLIFQSRSPMCCSGLWAVWPAHRSPAITNLCHGFEAPVAILWWVSKVRCLFELWHCSTSKEPSLAKMTHNFSQLKKCKFKTNIF